MKDSDSSERCDFSEMLNMSTLYPQIIKVIWKDFFRNFFYPIVRLSWESAIYHKWCSILYSN